jgi:dipeptidyl aminopeptidase/acylaminoacyl peptidase
VTIGLIPFVVGAAAVLGGGYLLLVFAVRRAYRAPRLAETGTPADFGLPFRTVSIPTENGSRLHAWYVLPLKSSGNAPAVVAIHGWGGNAEFMLPFAALFHRAGYATLLLDARNHGGSDADTYSSMPRFAEDLEHGFDWLAAQAGIDPQHIALLGHSVGAGAALLMASHRRDVAAVVSIAAFSHPEVLMRRQVKAHHIPYIPFGWMVLRYIERTIGTRYDMIAPLNTIKTIRCPVLLVHGCQDRSVPVADAEAIYAQRAHQRVELCLLQEADHHSVEHIETHGEDLLSFLRGAFQDGAEGIVG